VALFSKDDDAKSDGRPVRARRITASAPRNTSKSKPKPLAIQAPVPGAYTAASYSAPRPITAAAVQMKLDDKGEVEKFKQRRKGGSTDWQNEAWEYYDAIGEIKYAFNLVASVVSRIRLYAAAVDNPAENPVAARDSDVIDPNLAAAAERALARLDSAYGRTSGPFAGRGIEFVRYRRMLPRSIPRAQRLRRKRILGHSLNRRIAT
jgi:hypothetical protein